MSWVALSRAIQITERLGLRAPVRRWRRVMDRIQAQVLSLGWSARQGAFVQRYGSDALDAAALLIPIFGFLPADDPRVVSTVDRIAELLTIDGLVHRFDPEQVPGIDARPLGDFEGAFLPCTFWLASGWVLLGRLDEAEALLRRVEQLAGPIGLLSEAIDARTHHMAGNTPLLLSHAEYVRAVRLLNEARAARQGRRRRALRPVAAERARARR